MHPSRHLEDLVRAKIEPVEHVSSPLHHVAVTGVVDHHRIEPPHVERRLTRGRHGQQERTLDFTLQERADHADRLPAMVERRGEPLPLLPQPLGQPLHLGAGRHEHGHPALLLHDVPDVALVEELVRRLGQDLHLGLELGIERLRGEDVGALEVARVERGVDGGAEPDEARARPLPQGEAQLQLGRGLVDLVHHDRVAVGDEAVLEPPPRDPGRDDHDVPVGRVRCGLPLAVHHADVERLPQDRLGDRPDRERLSRAGARHDPEPLPRGGQGPDLGAVLALQQGVQMQPDGKLDRLAGRARRCDDDDAPRRMRSVAVGVGIGREMVVAGRVHEGMNAGRGLNANA